MKIKKEAVKILISVAAASAVILFTLCLVFVLPGKGSGKGSSNKGTFSNQNPLQMIVEAAEISVYDGENMGSTEAAVTPKPDLDTSGAVINANLNSDKTTAEVTITGLEKAEKMTVAVWSEIEGQDDILWYDMVKAENGIFKAEVPVKNHHTEGAYKADAYIIRSDESKYSACSTGFTVEGPSLAGASFENINNNAGIFQIKINKAQSVSGAKKAKVKVYPVQQPKSSHTYETELSPEGDGIIDINVSNHNYISGEYKAEITIVDGNNIEKNLLQIAAAIELPQMAIAQNMNSEGTIVNLVVSNLIENSVSKLDFEVYSKAGGKDDLVKYPGDAKSGSSYEANVVISNHHTAGEYQVDVYGVRGGGGRQLLGSATFNVSAPSAGSVSIPQKNENDEYFKAAISGASSKSGIVQMRFQVVRSSDGKESWYEAVSPASGNAEITVDIKDQTESVDTYTVTGYIKDTNGIEVKTNQTEVSMTFLNNGKYKIMGQSRTNVNQMVKYFKANATYPSFYANTEAPTIEAFCQIFYDEAVAEGVRAEVAFCQAMKETGYLKFGGDVSPSQYNFGGIGATGGGEPGNSFGSVTEGIRAQVQHLKAYADTGSLNKACVDPRFQYVKRGSAEYVEWLGIGDNPNGGGWAAGQGYGPSIVNSYIRKLFSY